MEFGSDFHLIDNFPKGKSIIDLTGPCRLYADGRQVLEVLAPHCNIKRMWLPSYYCHESVAGLKRMGVAVEYYPCNPTDNQDEAINYLKVLPGDGLVRMNYFGMNPKPKTPDGHFTIIEDHSHCLTSGWALNSEADWCFASLRKTMPIADGGILWSPKSLKLPDEPKPSRYGIQNACKRYAAMSLKTDYLNGKAVDKQQFLSEFGQTEETFDSLPISSISQRSKSIVSELDIIRWNDIKKRNWDCLCSLVHTNDTCTVLKPQLSDCRPFSFILIFQSKEIRDIARHRLISNEVYPAVLWPIPDGNYEPSIDFGNCMLSIHCDGRYSESDIIGLSNRINKSIAK